MYHKHNHVPHDLGANFCSESSTYFDVKARHIYYNNFMEKYVFGQFGPEHLEAIKEGIELFNDKKYWECHEVLEDLWLDHVGDNARYIYWAIIQVAASMFHFREGNIIGAWGMLFKAQKKIRKCEEIHVETELLYKYLDWKEFKELVFFISKKTPLEGYKKLYDFKFPNPNDWR